MHPLVRRYSKAFLELTLPGAEWLAGFRTPRGGYLPERIRMLFGHYEANELHLMKQFLRPGQTVLDVGANVGYLTRFFARLVGPAGKVYAFEPNPTIFPLLERNLSKFDRVTTYNVALSNTSAERPLFLAGRDQSVGSFAPEYPAKHVIYQEDGRVHSVAAKLVQGDEFLATIGVEKVDVLKVDVEGWELHVLKGLEQTIAASTNLTIFCEFNPLAQECAGWRRIDLFNWFFDRRFTLFRSSAGRLDRIARASVQNFVDQVEPGRFVTIFATAA